MLANSGNVYMAMFANVAEAQQRAIEAYEEGNTGYSKDLFFAICQERKCLHSAEVLVNLLCAELYNDGDLARLTQIKDLLGQVYNHTNPVVLIMLAQSEYRLTGYYQHKRLCHEQDYQSSDTMQYRTVHAKVTELIHLQMCAWKNVYKYLLMLSTSYKGYETTGIRDKTVLQLLQERFSVSSITELAEQTEGQIHKKHPVSAARIINSAKQEATDSLRSAEPYQKHAFFRA
jgi:hypothetical protein